MKHNDGDEQFALDCAAIQAISGTAGFKVIVTQLDADRTALALSRPKITDDNYALLCAKRDGKIEAITETLNALTRALNFRGEEGTPPTEA